MKVLITGNFGFIGTNLTPLFKNYVGWDYVHGQDIFDHEIESEIEAADAVIHLAAMTSVNLSFKHPELTYKVNILGTARIVELCSKYNKKLVYPSSAAVMYPDLSPYAKSKKMAEDIVVSMMPHNKFTVLRLFNVFGPHMNADSGSIMYRFLTDKKIVIYGDGEQTRDYVHVRDVCRIMKYALHSSWNGKIIEVGMGQDYSVNYIAGLFAYYRNKKMTYMPPRREIRWSKANISALQELYPYKLSTDIERDVKELCELQ